MIYHCRSILAVDPLAPTRWHPVRTEFFNGDDMMVMMIVMVMTMMIAWEDNDNDSEYHHKEIYIYTYTYHPAMMTIY